MAEQKFLWDLELSWALAGPALALASYQLMIRTAGWQRRIRCVRSVVGRIGAPLDNVRLERRMVRRNIFLQRADYRKFSPVSSDYHSNVQHSSAKERAGVGRRQQVNSQSRDEKDAAWKLLQALRRRSM